MAWTLIKNGNTATCEVWSHVFGFELRAFIVTELVLSAVRRAPDDLIHVREEWRAVFVAKGSVE